MVTTARPLSMIDGQPCTPDTTTDFAPGIERAFELHPPERCYSIEDIEGDIPSFLLGTYFLNGPAQFSRAGMRYRHWLDGDGMVCSLRFDHYDVRFTNRFVRTTKFTNEQKAARPLFRTFGTAFDGDLLNHGMALESPANVSVYPFHGKLLAFGEQALPWELDPLTLETIGQFNFGGSLSEVTPFSAHPKFDPATGEMFNFGVFFAGRVPKVCLYSFDQTGKLRNRTNHPLPYPSLMHDFGVSHNYTVFYMSPLLLDVEKMIRGGRSLMECLTWHPERGSSLLVLDRYSGRQVACAPIGSKYCLHMINCFEDEGKLVVDVVELDRPIYDQYEPLPDLFSNVAWGRPVRLVVDTERSEVVAREESEHCSAPDFPALDPSLYGRQYQEFWMLDLSNTGRQGRKFFDQLVHASWAGGPLDIFHASSRHYLGGEPIFVGGPEDGQGVVICQQFDADRLRSSFLIFDAFNVAGGPLASLQLKDAIPLGFHASFLTSEVR
jgi:all-trans-8'-apo-beta-carotenal 15,15'-oxygenase